VISAFKAGFKRSILPKKCRVISTLEICPDLKLRPSSPMESVCNIVTLE
jgi:hypothetical protein